MKTLGVLIDLDGTLLHTVPDLAAACNAMLAQLQRPPLSEKEVADYVGKGAQVLVHRCLTRKSDGLADAALHSAAMVHFDRHYAIHNGQHAALYPGVIEGLEAMKSAGLQLACVTNKPQVFADVLMDRAGLSGYFSFVQGGDRLNRKKPDPLPMSWAASRLGISNAQCVAIGDSMNDCLAAKAAGMTMLMVPYGYNEGREVRADDPDAGFDAVVGSLAEAARWVLSSRS
jgi:phosphoglycolate phosphatase